ncbi:hypothetical protein EV121DRAFT_218352, partial [Schizophyllum commune]
RDARLVLSTARSSTHCTGEFAVLGSARGVHIDAPRSSWPRRDGGMPCVGSGGCSCLGSHALADAPPCDGATCHTRTVFLPPPPTALSTPLPPFIATTTSRARHPT